LHELPHLHELIELALGDRHPASLLEQEESAREVVPVDRDACARKLTGLHFHAYVYRKRRRGIH
jgi:hypothetical protein